ncbi:GNAT family N-acetyltransferase [Pseudomonas tussilaginis]|uniref:GNAT family N-acetyltransferase n=1 Tax=Pseudomonas TaxID=286 RepID=UPI0006991F66|nr:MULTISPECIES: GNAT family N-acetyltransferase [Pseudomonas]MDD1977313.1 GNAT family N-acetyltransferase [Pseudomonas putida]
MVKIVVFDETPPKHVMDQVLRLVGDNASELSVWGTPRNNLQSEIYQWGLVEEVGQYLRLMGKLAGAPSELVVANDDASDAVIGFVLYLPTPADKEACGVTYMAVDLACRGQGVARTMMAKVVERYPHVELTCSVRLVPFYERIGFQLLEESEHPIQVVMNTRNYSPSACMGTLNVEDIFGSDEAKRRQTLLVQRYGRAAVEQSIYQFHQHINALQLQSWQFVNRRRVTRWLPGAQSIANATPDGAILLKTFTAVLMYIVDNGQLGACHESSAILYMLLLEQGVDAELVIGEVRAGALYFDHSWVEVGGLIYDPAVGFPHQDGENVGPAIFASRDLLTGQETGLKYGATSPTGFDKAALKVAPATLKQYAKHQPTGATIWDLTPRIAVEIGLKRIGRDFKLKYGNHTRSLRRVNMSVPAEVHAEAGV